MPPQTRTEFRKLATIRSPWLLLAAGPVIVVAGITGLVLSWPWREKVPVFAME